MPLIECKLGAASPHVAGTTYAFEIDRAGRYVAQVHNEDHVAILLAVEHYKIASELTAPLPPVVETAPTPEAEPETPPNPPVQEPDPAPAVEEPPAAAQAAAGVVGAAEAGAGAAAPASPQHTAETQLGLVDEEIPFAPSATLTPAQIAALDGDGDGNAGGSLPRAQRKAPNRRAKPSDAE